MSEKREITAADVINMLRRLPPDAAIADPFMVEFFDRLNLLSGRELEGFFAYRNQLQQIMRTELDSYLDYELRRSR